MPETGSNSSSASGLTATITLFDATILAGTNSITVTHNKGYVVKVNGVYGIDDNVNLFKIINEGINSFDVAIGGGILAGANTAVQGTYE